jgi:ABC-type glycerol-3-phosphate transport system substrate-binding protein
MKFRLAPLLAVAAAVAAIGAAQAAASDSPVTVSFVEPDRFADLGDRVIDEPRNLKTLEAWFKTRDKPCASRWWMSIWPAR